jgi:hypothetical protein
METKPALRKDGGNHAPQVGRKGGALCSRTKSDGSPYRCVPQHRMSGRIWRAIQSGRKENGQAHVPRLLRLAWMKLLDVFVREEDGRVKRNPVMVGIQTAREGQGSRYTAIGSVGRRREYHVSPSRHSAPPEGSERHDAGSVDSPGTDDRITSMNLH